ncbi:MAG: putative pyridoxal-dependent aspartate 1-decarboxylase [Burkholderiaceae bacterium]
MTTPHINLLLQKHFSIAAIELAPAPIHKSLRLLADWMSARQDKPYPKKSFTELIREFGNHKMPVEGMEVDAFLDEFNNVVLLNTAQLNHPMYIGHMTQALPWITVVAEAFTAALNQNQVKIETAFASTVIEKQILGWMHHQVYKCPDNFYAQAMAGTNFAIGNIVNGGTMGNLTALAVALEQKLPGTRKEGLHVSLSRSGYRGLAVIGSTRIHYSLKKAMATLGLGEDSLHLIPVNRDNRMDLGILRSKLAELKHNNIKTVALIGIAGTTETGAIDPLAELAEIAQQEQAWFHVDAAWGGALLLSEQFKPLYRGVEMADSVVIDGHKLLWVPMAQSMVLFRNSESLTCLKHSANYIIRDNSGDLGQTSLEGSRRFDALKLWTAFKVLGVKGYEALLQQAASLTGQMRNMLNAHEDFELISDSDTFILTYRYVPQYMQEQIIALLGAGRVDDAAILNKRINVLNVALQERQKSQGKSFVSRTTLESTNYPGETAVLRVVLSNVMTEPWHLRAILSEQADIGRTLLNEQGSRNNLQVDSSYEIGIE